MALELTADCQQLVRKRSDAGPMLQRTMIQSSSIRNGLEDLLADLHYARRNQELGRLALLAYCEVRSWARQADELELADHSTQIFTQNPCVSKNEFLAKVDALVAKLEALMLTFPEPARMQTFRHVERTPQQRAVHPLH